VQYELIIFFGYVDMLSKTILIWKFASVSSKDWISLISSKEQFFFRIFLEDNSDRSTDKKFMRKGSFISRVKSIHNDPFLPFSLNSPDFSFFSTWKIELKIA
jgi:hypothetical protein